MKRRSCLPILRTDFEQAAQRYARAMDAYFAARSGRCLFKRPGRSDPEYYDPPTYACDWQDWAEPRTEDHELCENCLKKRRNRAALQAARREQRLAKNQFRRAWKRWQEAEKP